MITFYILDLASVSHVFVDEVRMIPHSNVLLIPISHFQFVIKGTRTRFKYRFLVDYFKRSAPT